jgi:RNA polymerase sigma factor (sigma-70 family)
MESSMKEGAAFLAKIFIREKSRFLRFVVRQRSDMDDAEAEDILSDVTYNLLRHHDVIDEIENLTAYIYRSLANRVRNYRRERLATVAINGPADNSGTGAVEIPDTRPRPDEAVEQRELRDHLLRAIDQLGAKERAVWIATEIDGRSFRDLAEEWDEPIGTLLSRKSRASATLRRLLSDYKNNQ